MTSRNAETHYAGDGCEPPHEDEAGGLGLMPEPTPTPQPAPDETPAGSTGPARPHAAHLSHAQLADAEWRVGGSLGRTLYAVVGGGDRKADVLIGSMDTERLGERVVADHNDLGGALMRAEMALAELTEAAQGLVVLFSPNGTRIDTPSGNVRVSPDTTARVARLREALAEVDASGTAGRQS